jgi:UDP-glucose 4-epimerase
MKKILVTGGAGYIGSHTVVELLNAGYQPIIIDDFRNSEPFILERIEKITNKEVICYDLDCNNKENLIKVFSEHSIEGVIHFAAYKAVGESVEKPLEYYENNVGSLVSILKIMNQFQCKNLVFSSSCTVYGEPESGIVNEDSPVVKAKSPYGQTKVICEDIIKDTIASSSNLSSVILRYFNPIGAHESGLIGELPIGHPNNLVPFITQSAIGKRGPLTIFGNDYNTIDGTCVRDYIHVVDLAIAHIKALDLLFESSKELEILNVGTGNGNSVLELVEKFEKINEIKVNWEYGNRRDGDVEKVFADATKVKKSLNWSCKYSTEDALKHAWNWEKQLQK